MPVVDLICLANSTKLGGRCFAGLRLDGKGWVRPIASDTDHGQLYSRHYRLEGGAEPEVLDVIGVDLAEYRPLPDQPENWLIGSNPWILRRRPGGPELYATLRSALEPGPALLGSTGKHVPARTETRALSSLTLIAPLKVQWILENDLRGRPQPRVIFDLRGQPYNVPVTDPAWTSRVVRTLTALKSGAYLQEIIGISKYSNILFTVSLSEPFQGYCYKLVAGIVEIGEALTHLG